VRALITGANRGIGFEFTRRLLGRGDTVFAACRAPESAEALRALGPERLTILPLDIRDDATIAAMAGAVAERVDGLDLLINNAGIGSNLSPHRAQLADLGSLDREKMADMLHTNAVSPILVAQSVKDLICAASGRIVNISSNIGSIGGKNRSGRYAYGASKAALNYMTKALAIDLRERGVLAVAIHPGWVRTDMGGANAAISVEVSVDSMLRIIDRLSPLDSGMFFNYDGNPLPY
jgi:NAD(P)-dependent dehydrogenase (short-subunit alcohol dehydrogenase family)